MISISCQGSQSYLQEAAIVALAGLEVGGQLQVLNHERTLVGLVGCLSKDENPSIQLYAAMAFKNLANGPKSSKLQILKEESALAELVKCVSKHDNPDLQRCARGALENLVAGGEEIRLQILDENPAIAGLLNSVFEDYDSHLQDREVATL